MSDPLTEMTRMEAESNTIAVVGIDPSLTGTAVVFGDGVKHESCVYSSKANGRMVRNRIARFTGLADDVCRFLHRQDAKLDPDRVAIYIEGYSHMSNGNAMLDLAEYGGILRREIDIMANGGFNEVPPTTLKKFAIGTGGAKKDEVRLGVFKHWGFEAPTNDECDAFALYQFGLCCEGLAEPKNKIQRDVIEKFMKTRA